MSKMIKDFEGMKSRITQQATVQPGEDASFQEISLLEYTEFFQSNMLLENPSILIMTLSQYYNKLMRMQGIGKDEDDIFRPANEEKRRKIT